jgi:hypothetical protein
MEMITIRESVMVNSGGLRMMLSVDQSMLKQDDEDDIAWLRKLEASLYITDIIILAYCKYTEGRSFAHLQLSLKELPQAAFDSATLDDAIRELDRLINKQNNQRALFEVSEQQYSLMSQIAGVQGSVHNIFDFFIFLGRSRTLMRWYRVRKSLGKG